jgi:chromosome segregation ATPase
MNDPIQRIEDQQEKLRKRVDDLERLEKKLDFSLRDISYKTDLAQGMMKALHGDVGELKSEMITVREDIEYLKLRADESDKKLDLIIGFLEPKPKE